MKGLEKLKYAELYNITTQFGQLLKQVAFEGFQQENEDVKLAVFSDPVSAEFFYFDISVSGIDVEVFIWK